MGGARDTIFNRRGGVAYGNYPQYGSCSPFSPPPIHEEEGRRKRQQEEAMRDTADAEGFLLEGGSVNPWPLVDEHGLPVRPYRVCRVQLPWLPADGQAQVLMLSGALLHSALSTDCGWSAAADVHSDGSRGSITVGQRLNSVLDSLMVLVPPASLGVEITPEIAGSHARHYLRNLSSVISLWDDNFVPAIKRANLVFDVVVGSEKLELLQPLMDSPFQVPPGRILFRAVLRGARNTRILTPDGRVWGARGVNVSGGIP